MSAFFERYKDEYVDKLFRVSAQGDWQSWIEFCLRGTAIQADDAIKRFDGLLALKEEYHQRAVTGRGSARLQQIIEGLFESPVATAPQLARQFEVTYPTAQKDIQRLICLDILVESRQLSNTKHYLAPRVVDIAYGD